MKGKYTFNNSLITITNVINYSVHWIIDKLVISIYQKEQMSSIPCLLYKIIINTRNNKALSLDHKLLYLDNKLINATVIQYTF